MTASAPRLRRTQAERRASTQSRLLEATIDCLGEQGYAGTTTALIEAQAGVSRGARLHHFPTKAALVTAAAAHLVTRMSERYAGGMREAAETGRPDRFHVGVGLLWDLYADPRHAALLELFVAARTDPELREALRVLWPGLHEPMRRRANADFPELARRDASGLLELLQAALAGLALRRFAFGSSAREEEILQLLERMVKTTFDTAPTGDET